MQNKLNKFSIGTSAYGSRVSDKTSVKIIEKLLYHGINKIDTSPFYGLGFSEKNVGKAIKNYKREDLFLTSKFGITSQKVPKFARKILPIVKKTYSIPGIKFIMKKNIKIKNDEILTLDQINQTIFQSLNDINICYLDCLLIHTNIYEYLNNQEIIDYLLELKSKKIINQIGVTASKVDNIFLDLVSKFKEFINVIQIPYKEFNKEFTNDFKVNYYSIFSNNLFLENDFVQKYHANNGNFIILNTDERKVEERINYFNQIL